MTAYVKPMVDTAGIVSAISHHLGEGATGIAPVSGGNLSSVFAFSLNGAAYIIKFSDMEHAYETEGYVSRLLRQQGIPFPRCMGQGKAGLLAYSILERIPGRNLVDCTAEEQSLQLPELIRMLTAMNHMDVGATGGFGWIQPDGNGAFPAWRDYVVSFFADEQTGFWEGWREIPGLEQDVVDECYQRLLAYSVYNEPHRHFIHGDVSPWNILSDGRRITGIIDGNFAYGDFIVDVATLKIMMGETDVVKAYQECSEKLGIDIPDFQKRMIGAYYFKGLDGLRFFAKMGRDRDYRYMRQFLLSLTS
ncbi:aminoglycoside phosphotransferase family protein [Paenibacillus rhizovicinus]|uniref:Aminoglycoside phosphotransferase family protein n=1 Tax=Paenibacillus rhizovicinus TaxID=2704463 RepID=A0A6C0NY57_9BACL|nr:aminoglycoside phosphotransferase family protein [Paenibacillus rhizovicinus]QHW31170.1 aminoglycoside phosphotransferase family protein [Paenibacillus rhizovicinus]